MTTDNPEPEIEVERLDRVPCPSLDAIIDERVLDALETHALGEQVTWTSTIVPGPNGIPVANIWLSIPLGLVGQARGGWSHAMALDAASPEGEHVIDDVVRQALERLRAERSNFLADPEGFAQAEAAREAQAMQGQGHNNGLN